MEMHAESYPNYGRPTIDLRRQEVKGWKEGQGAEDEPRLRVAELNDSALETRQRELRIFERQAELSGLEGRAAGLRQRLEIYRRYNADRHLTERTEDELKAVEERLNRQKAA